MLERVAHWIGTSHYWLAEWKDQLIVAYGPFPKEDAHRYIVRQIAQGEKVALAHNKDEMPIFLLLSNLGWPRERERNV